MASEDLKRLVAREIAHGETVAEVARRHSYSWKGMYKLVQTEDVQRLVAREREDLEQMAVQARARLLTLAPQALENLQRIVEDPGHSHCLSVSRWVVDKVLPRRPDDRPEVQVNIVAAEVIQDAVRQVREVRAMLERSGPPPPMEKFLLRGTQGLTLEAPERPSGWEVPKGQSSSYVPPRKHVGGVGGEE